MRKQNLKKLTWLFLFTILILVSLLLLGACKKEKPRSDGWFSSYTAVYSADSNGSLIGETKQRIRFWKDASEVTAVPNEGYIFAGWSDGVYLPTRHDKHFEQDIEVCATFIRKTKILKYDYNGATSNNTATTLTLDYDNLTDLSFTIPIKANYEFQGWYLDKEFTRRVTDKDGVYYLGKSIFYSDADTLYARWEARVGIVYPALMLFIGNIDARFQNTTTKEIYSINHEISIPEIKICEQITYEVSNTLNEWFEGKVYFEFDSFFTSSAIDARSYQLYTLLSPPYMAYPQDNVVAPCVLEVAPILKNYRSVLTTSYTIAVSEKTGYADRINKISERAGMKYGNLSLDATYIGVDLSKSFNLDALNWGSIKDGYLHEFTHTIEQAIELDDYHEFGVYYSQDHHYDKGDSLKGTKLYLLNQAELNGNITGIPFAYWKGEITVNYLYIAQKYYGMGNIKLIDGEIIPGWNLLGKVSYGSSVTVEAVANEGYRFVAWSDGVLTAIRTDENITSYLCVYAIFEKF